MKPHLLDEYMKSKINPVTDYGNDTDWIQRIENKCPELIEYWKKYEKIQSLGIEFNLDMVKKYSYPKTKFSGEVKRIKISFYLNRNKKSVGPMNYDGLLKIRPLLEIDILWCLLMDYYPLNYQSVDEMLMELGYEIKDMESLLKYNEIKQALEKNAYNLQQIFSHKEIEELIEMYDDY